MIRLGPLRIYCVWIFCVVYNDGFMQPFCLSVVCCIFRAATESSVPIPVISWKKEFLVYLLWDSCKNVITVYVEHLSRILIMLDQSESLLCRGKTHLSLHLKPVFFIVLFLIFFLYVSHVIDLFDDLRSLLVCRAHIKWAGCRVYEAAVRALLFWRPTRSCPSQFISLLNIKRGWHESPSLTPWSLL